MANYLTQPVQGYQGGGKAGTAFGLQSLGIKTQRDLIKKAASQSKSMGWFDTVLSLASLFSGLGGLKYGAGLLGFDPLSKGASLAKTLLFTVPKAAKKGLGSWLYQPKDFKSKTGLGLDKYGQLSERGEKFRQRGMESAATSFFTDTLMAMMPNPFRPGERMGTLGDQVGVTPKEWGKYTPTADALHTAAIQRRPEVEKILRQSMFKEQPIPAFGKTPQVFGGSSSFKLGYTPQASIFGNVLPSANTMHSQALQNIATESAAARNLASEMNMGGRTDAFNADLQSFIDLLGQGGK